MQQAIEVDDPFASRAGVRLAPASLKRYLMGWRRFLGFLAIAEPEDSDRSG
jgi:hypothetical protein